MKKALISAILGVSSIAVIGQYALADAVPMIITGNISTPTCTVSPGSESIDVNLGVIDVNNLQSIDSMSNKVAFSINLEECTGGQNIRPAVKFSGIPISAEKNTILALTDSEYTAKNIGVAIFNEGDTEPVQLDSSTRYVTPEADGTAKLNFEAGYISLGNVQPGSGNAVATFDIVYE